ncbi:hypothetical protein LCGC14_1155940 [marine sediment metagenome]|uniref:Uncharacterized protein n=1 Tax=marine sediment metagenome TaxID=412755 RepID=A0A0F9LU02_9ZZZZ
MPRHQKRAYRDTNGNSIGEIGRPLSYLDRVETGQKYVKEHPEIRGVYDYWSVFEILQLWTTLEESQGITHSWYPRDISHVVFTEKDESRLRELFALYDWPTEAQEVTFDKPLWICAMHYLKRYHINKEHSDTHKEYREIAKAKKEGRLVIKEDGFGIIVSV